MVNSWSGGYVHTPSSDARACGCIGPQNGQPRCPCMMRGMRQINGRWVEVIDHGPVKAGEEFDWGTAKLMLENINKTSAKGTTH